MFKSSRDFTVLSLERLHAVEDWLQEEQHATALSIIAHYMQRPESSQFSDTTLLEFARQYSMPKTSIRMPQKLPFAHTCPTMPCIIILVQYLNVSMYIYLYVNSEANIANEHVEQYLWQLTYVRTYEYNSGSWLLKFSNITIVRPAASGYNAHSQVQH